MLAVKRCAVDLVKKAWLQAPVAEQLLARPAHQVRFSIGDNPPHAPERQQTPEIFPQQHHAGSFLSAFLFDHDVV